MSAFIVNSRCMNACVLATWRHTTAPEVRNPLRLTLQEGTRLGRQLYALNARAVSQRYREPPDLDLAESYVFGQDHEGPREVFTGLPHIEPVVQHKAIACLLYQCSEGDVPESGLYQTLLKVRQALAEEIVCALPAWEQAPWG